MIKVKPSNLIVLFLIFIVSSCTRRVMVRKYYLIEADPVKLSKIEKFPKSLDFKVDVRDFTVDRAYRQTSIVLRSGEHELNYYYYHYWAVRPGLAIADMIFRVTEYSGLFTNCYRGFSYQPDYIIQGNIQQLERIQKKKAVSVHIRGNIDFIKAENGEREVHYNFDRIVGLGSKNSMDASVDAVNSIIMEEAVNFTKKCAEYFKVKTPKVKK